MSGTPAASQTVSPHTVQSAFLKSLVGKPIRCRLVDGKGVSGILVAFDTFTLHLNGSASLLLFKQSIAYISAEVASEAAK